MMKKYLVIAVVLFSCLFAQNSFHSQNGYGLTGENGSVRSQGLGNTGGAISDSLSLTSENPAFWYNFETTSLQGVLNTSSLKAEKLNDTYTASGLSGFSLKFPVGEYIGVAMGLTPNFRANFETSNLHQQVFDGDTILFANESNLTGGISEAFLGFGYKFGSRLSFGVKSKILFGNYNYNNVTDKGDNNSTDSKYSEKLKMSGLQTELGVGWKQKDNFSIGLSYTIPLSFNYRSKFDFSWGEDQSTENENVKLPSRFTISLQKKLIKQLYFTSDFYYLEDYSELVEKVGFFNDIKSDNSYYIGFGLERVHSKKIEKNLLLNYNYRLGAFYRTEPFYLNSDQVMDLGITLGVGIPMNFNMTQVDVAFQYIQRTGFLDDEIGKENIYKLNIGITTGGLWFRR
jgi:hypothetical protein